MKSERFNIRMTPREKAAIIGRAKRAGCATSEFMIDTALNRKIIVIDGLPEMVRELKALMPYMSWPFCLCTPNLKIEGKEGTMVLNAGY